MNNSIFYSMLMLAAGFGIPVMATLNAGLGGRLQSPALAVVILLVVGFIVASSYLFATEGISTFPDASINWYFYMGGVLFVFYILSITWVVPKFGVANAISFVLVGQLLAMSAIDHFGLFGAAQYTVTFKRAIGLALMCVGVFFVVAKPSQG